MPSDPVRRPIVVRGTEINHNDPSQAYRQKIARVTLDSMVQFVGLLDAAGTVLEINKVALDAVGLTLADVEGKSFWDTFWWQVSPEINQGIRDAIARAVRGEFVRWDTPLFASPDGSITIIIDASVMPVKDDDGKVVFLACEGRDITEKKAQEREIAAKNVELQGLLERIRELDEIKTQFFANVSHELRTPLALIIGPAQRLIDDDGSIGLGERRESAQVIARNARMLLKHVNDLLDLSKLEAGKLKIELQDIDVAALLRFLASHFGALAADRRIDLIVDAGEPCVTAVDQEKLQRVLMNLLSNAFKFAPDGGRIRCRLTRSDSDVTIAVDDSGPGVRSDLRQAIFERFRQADGGSNRTRGGTGLGLAIAKEFVELHRGRIEALDSDLGGARFQITIPMHRSQSAVAEPVLDQSTLGGVLEELRPDAIVVEQDVTPPIEGRPTVLVVEDNADMNRFVTECLARDYHVVSAVDGGDGVEKAKRHRPALIVSDIMMPRVSGEEMVAQLRDLDELRDTPVLMLSAKADDELQARLLEGGVLDFIVKPFSERDLLARVRNIIAGRQARERADNLRFEAETANRAKDEFLAILGHELRNPLSPILTALQLMKLRGPDESDRARLIIERQVKQLTRLVDDLLDVSRIARGKVDLQTQVVELAEIVAKAIETASPMLEQRNHDLTVDVPRHGLPVDADPIRLGQVIANLLTNAARYTPSGGRVAVGAVAVGDTIVLSVKDNGIGIAKELLPRVFDLFVQETHAVDRAQGGLGIGLTIVRNLVERHGGRVVATSDGPGKGSEFIVRLPKAAVAATIEGREIAPRNPS